jgi:nucleotide-binding universal stress UspA family protein
MASPDKRGRVIVAVYDGSATEKAAVDYAARAACPVGHDYVVHAYGPPADWLGFPNDQRVLDDHQERGRALINGLALGDDPLLDTQWDAELLEGPAAEALVDVARAREADEIVVGSHGRGRLARTALGSVSHDLLHRSEVPVVVIPPVRDPAQA